MSDFYLGYSPKAPVGLARFIRRIIFAFGLLTVTVALVLVCWQKPFANSTFEYGMVRTFEGVIVAKPYPALWVTRPGELQQQEKDSQYLLVARGKHGADDLVSGFDGKQVSLQGQLIYRGGGTMVEIVPGSITSGSIMSGSTMPLRTAPSTPDSIRKLGAITVTGEIVDSKCYLGVMNPGNGKVHRDCAARCLSGGIPPLFVTTNGESQFLLVGLDGEAIGHDVLREFVAEPITVRGELMQRGDTRLIRIDPESLRHSQSRGQIASNISMPTQ